MENVIVVKHHKARRPVSASGFACLVATFSASIAAVMLSISLGLSWPEYLSLAFTAAALTFGARFTIYEMRRSTNKRN
jgi:hypothetical protein